MSKPYPDERLKLSRARLLMIQQSAFLATINFSIVNRIGTEVPTAATNSKEIIYNPDFINKLSQDELFGLILHETYHIALNHCALQEYSRIQGRDPHIWNIAADVVINNFIIDAGYKLPEGGVYMPEHRNKTTEEIYQYLVANAVKVQCSIGSDIQESGDAKNTLSDDQIKKLQNNALPESEIPIDDDLKDILLRASMASHMAGEDSSLVPGSIKLLMERFTKPKLPWDRLLLRYCRSKVNQGYNFQKPNRRFFPDMHIPGRTQPGLNHVQMAIDMSASVTDEQVSIFVSEVIGVINKLKPKKLTLLEFDTKLSNVTQIKSAHQLKQHEFTGRGGTYIQPVLDYAYSHPSDLLLVFTDGEFGIPPSINKIPLAWVIYDNPGFRAPVGKIFHTKTF